jgi:hypothetical protein
MTSGIDFSHYNAPGVYTQSVPGPQIGVYSTSPVSVGIFGQARGYRTAIETLTIPPDTDQTHAAPTSVMSQTGIMTDSLVVRDPVTGNAYTVTTDYTVNEVLGASGLRDQPDTSYTITRTIGGAIPVSKQVQVSYNYTDSNYFNAMSFYTYNDVVDQYGPALGDDGSILSELTFAASFAFSNGAQRVVCAPCTNPGSVTVQDYQNALDQLEQDGAIGVVVPATGQQAVHAITKTHVDLQSTELHERRAIVGRDGTVTPVSSATRMQNAEALFDSRVAMISPATVYYYNPLINQIQTIGSQFLAAALAGVAVSINPAKPLTRMTVNGFVSVAESMSNTQKNVETQAGLMVVESTNQGAIRVRHGVTTNFTNLLTREWSILGQQDAMISSLREYLEADGLIGQIIDNLTLSNIYSTTAASLSSLVNSGIILGYQSLSVRQLQSNPDVVEVSFEWQAAIPLNYIVVIYSVNIATGSITSTGSGGATTVSSTVSTG